MCGAQATLILPNSKLQFFNELLFSYAVSFFGGYLTMLSMSKLLHGKLMKGLEAAMAYSIDYPDTCVDRLRKSPSV
jgi:hypothetical protein